ncbi:MAG: signal peptide peptidase SppA [Proteobacteria bacterium]|nr:signal peptide peptidase SppA [Pseudomonadota bacterium]
MSFSLLSSKQDKKKSLPRRHPVLFPFVVFICLLIVYQFFGEAVVTPGIGIVEVNGVILESEPIVKKLRILESDPAVRGIIVRINSPGGAVSPSQEIYSEILRLKKKKKVYVSISSTAASGGYYIAIAADKLFANPGSMIGSIGVIIQTFNVEGLMDKLGIKSEVIKAGKNKDIGSAFRQMKPSEKILLEKVVKDTHEQFITAVADSRSLDIKKVREIADGRVFTGNQAKDTGLIDEVASFRQTAEHMRLDLDIQEQMSLVYPTSREEILDSLVDLESLLNIGKFVEQNGLFYLATPLLENGIN